MSGLINIAVRGMNMYLSFVIPWSDFGMGGVYHPTRQGQESLAERRVELLTHKDLNRCLFQVLY